MPFAGKGTAFGACTQWYVAFLQPLVFLCAILSFLLFSDIQTDRSALYIRDIYASATESVTGGFPLFGHFKRNRFIIIALITTRIRLFE